MFFYMDTIRTFIAITLPDDIHAQISMVINALKKEIEYKVVHWVTPGNIHLTLKFLGEIPESNILILQEELGREPVTHECFSLGVQGIGAFPTLRKPRVIWVSVTEPKELMSLQERIETITRKLGYDSENRPFSAHLTLGRVSHYATVQQIFHCGEVLSSCTVGRLGSFIVQSIEIYRSNLTAGGSVYTRLYSLPLKQVS
ncbi:MAG: RNA 2',3'-cyclic phosphodiesterase [Anaerolineaceae bacterium]